MSTAIVVGATGIIGRAIVERLIQDESISVIYTLSRKPGGHTHAHPKVRHAFLDLRASAQNMAIGLAGVSGTYIFFSAYTSVSDPEEMFKINNDMLTNFLTAVEITGATKSIKRFILTCGLKQYGCHLGESKQPMVESDPLLTDDVGGVKWPANFYYTQQKELAQAASKHGFEWICTLPKDVIGYAKGNFMNQATALGLYCAVSRALPGSVLPYPGSRDNFYSFNTWTSSDLHAKFCLWAAKATEPGVGNNVFNVVNGDTETWQALWPRLAERFGLTIPDAPFTTAEKSTDSSTFQLSTVQPLAANARALGISKDEKVSTPAIIDVKIDFAKWAKRPDVLEAWETIRDQYGLDQSAWDNATWDFMNVAFGRHFSTVASMSKARKLGWTGYEDTWDSFDRTFRILEEEEILPGRT
ncbi:unnamed protein product [Clonostachys rosea]|uniref:PRISE-like Rossmann-fold domain-containing protein n=1 Tax=Bionectria ochroleuca TaxID=29856 RepID=A0ABY6ULW8_BIOOC|nr:unnamed protein product [Clonostachys rosea]